MLMVKYFPSMQVIRSLIIMLAIFCNSPLHAELKEFEILIQKAKEEQDELFRINPASNEIAFESMG